MCDFPVNLSIQNEQPFIGSYERIEVDFGSSELNFDNVQFTISDGEAGGYISFARDELSGPNEIMLLVGYRPGKYNLQVTDTSGTVVGELLYEITSSWTDKDKSPAHWVVGELADFTTGYTWGGGPGTVQNVDVIPQSGTRNVCILTVDTSTARFPSGSAFDAIKSTWVDTTVGTAAGPDGKVRSAKAYYEEVSHGTFTLALVGSQAFSINLEGEWDNYFTDMRTLRNSNRYPANSYGATDRAAFAQACVSAAADIKDGAGNALVDFKTVQTLVLVVKSAGTGAADDFVWPRAWGGSFTIPGGSANLKVLNMPDDWTTHDTRELLETLCHEIGHNLGYSDLYTSAESLSDEVKSRDITNFDIMSRDGRLPHMTVGRKLETGWVRPEWVRTFDFSRSTVPVDETVSLRAAELAATPGGRGFAAVEVRIADGWNYYFEYRRGQANQIGDQELATGTDTGNAVVVGTDMISQSFTFPIARPDVLRLGKDAEMENSFFGVGEDYKETDRSSMAISDFRMSVVSISGNNARIRIQYGTNGRPDLYIRPWPAGNSYKSPDIVVENDRSIADPGQWSNQPWVGHANTVKAIYRNRGPVTARNVRVNFSILDLTVGGAPKVPLGNDIHDVPPETSTPTVEFRTSWVPQDNGHKCIIVETPLFLDTSVSPTLVELTDSNNSAQSNYTRYIAASASPARRGTFEVSLNNPFKARTEIYVVPQIQGQFAKFYRLYMETSAMKLDPGETKKVQVMVESMYGDPAIDDIVKKYEKKFFVDTHMSLRGYGQPAEDPSCPVLLGGVQMDVGSGKGTRFASFYYSEREEQLKGRVVTLDGTRDVTGRVLLYFRTEPERVGTSVSAILTAGGRFAVGSVSKYVKEFGSKCVAAHYLGQPGLAPCDAKEELHL